MMNKTQLVLATALLGGVWGAQSLYAKDRIRAELRSGAPSNPNRRGFVDYKYKTTQRLMKGIDTCEYVEFASDDARATSTAHLFDSSVLKEPIAGDPGRNRRPMGAIYCMGTTRCTFKEKGTNWELEGTLYFENVSCVAIDNRKGEIHCPPPKDCTLEGGEYLEVDVLEQTPDNSAQPRQAGQVR